MYIITTDNNNVSHYCLNRFYVDKKQNWIIGLNWASQKGHENVSNFNIRRNNSSNIVYYYDSGNYTTDIYIRVVIILNNGKVISGERYYIFNKHTIKKFNLVINEKIINHMCYLGRIDFLEWWVNSGLPLKYDPNILENILLLKTEKVIDIMTWWVNSGLPINASQSSIKVMEYASRNGNIRVLEWWKNSGIPLQYNELCLEEATKYGNIKVLDWWKNSGLKLKYYINILDQRDYVKELGGLEWWKNSGLPFQYYEHSLYLTMKYGHTDRLDWG